MPLLDQESVSVPTRVVLGSPPSHPSQDDVVLYLDHDEEYLCDVLVSTADAFERGDLVLPEVSPKHIEIRIAGGWVRDKIMGRYSHDVDLAVDCLTGKEFATLVQEYLKQKLGNHVVGDKSAVGTMGVIKANPSQSKHLETATMVVHHVEVDFTNLRGQEVYESHSRIPTTVFGTPLDDAQRRDFTANALFFNLRTRLVEDWTQRGIADLRRGILVTPIDPMTTFHDDPLRVLRAIRFAVRYNFALDDALERACVSKQVHKSLHVKVSRQRVGKELEGMLTGKGAQPQKALETITSLKLAGSVFIVPNNDSIVGTVLGEPYVGTHDELSHKRELAWEESCELLKLLPVVNEKHQASSSHGDETTSKQEDADTNESQVDTRLLHICTFVLPFRHLSYTDHKDKVQSVVKYMIRDGIQFKTKDVVHVTQLMDTVDKVMYMLGNAKVIVEKQGSLSTSKPFRLEAGVVLRSIKELWVTSLLLATIILMRQVDDKANTTNNASSEKEEILQLSSTVYHTIMEEMKLDGCWNMRPLLNGKALIALLDLPRGPQVGIYLEEQIKWMLLNPQGTLEECKRHLQQCKHNWENARQDDDELGMSDGVGPSSPVQSRKKIVMDDDDSKHFSKKMHVERMDLL